jgi:cell division septal protein FtsQ
LVYNPKSKNKISYHLERIYLTKSLQEVYNIIKEFQKLNNDEYSYLEIKYKDKLKIRKDPNYVNGFYTT